jgi:2,5-diketo-D-gluconate reductase A
VVARWHVQLGSVPIPKSADPGRQRQNLDVFAFDLPDQELEDITALGRADGRLFGGDTNIHEEM